PGQCELSAHPRSDRPERPHGAATANNRNQQAERRTFLHGPALGRGASRTKPRRPPGCDLRMNRPVVWGVLGTARIGKQKVIPAMLRSPLVQVRGIASRTLAVAEAAAQEMDIPRAYGDYAALLADPDIEAIYNPLPNHLHVPLTLAAARAGKHVLCEKPIALHAGEARQLQSVADQVHIAEAFMVRHHPQWDRIRALLREGRIGTLRAVQCVFSFFTDDPADIRNQPDIGGGALYDIGCYAVATARFVFGTEPLRV